MLALGPLRFERVHADALALLGCLFEPNRSVNQGKQRVVASYSDVATGLTTVPRWRMRMGRRARRSRRRV